MHLRLTDDEQTVDDVFSTFFANECPIERVRAAETTGHDPAAWERLVETGAPGMCADEAIGGGGADLATAAVAVRHLGTHLAPVPLIEHIVATRLLATVAPDHDALPAIVAGAKIATLALQPTTSATAKLTPAGAIADLVIALRGEELVAAVAAPTHAPRNSAGLPLADRDLTDATVVASGPDAVAAFATARAEWQALMASALAGLGHRATMIGVEYVKERTQFDVLIGTFQGVQHGLATAITGVEGATFLASRAIDALVRDQADAEQLAAMAFLFAAESSLAAAAAALQYHGGYGFAEEYDIQMYYRRAKGWALQYGDPSIEYQRLADLTLPAAKGA